MIPLPYTALLTVIAIGAGIAILIVFRRFSNRESLEFAKRQVWAQLYGLRLYADEPAVIWQVQKQLVIWNGRYLFHMLRPATIIVLPLSALMFFLDGFYGYRPLHPGESALVRTEEPSLMGHGVTIETPALRIPTAHRAYWRIRAGSEAGELFLGSSSRQRVYVGSGLAYVNACPRCFGNAIEVLYPPAHVSIFGYQAPWLFWFFFISSITLLVLRKRFQ